jgi:predicted aldo/keto reductase-like oxidoreductase
MSEHDRPQVDRREFLQAGAAVTAASALTLGATSAGLAQEPAKATKILPTRKLGKTGVDVTILNVGTGAWKSLGNAAPLLLRTAYANGIRYIDTAKAYGTEPDIAKFFKAVPEAKKDTFVVTKDTPKSPKQMIEQLDQNLARLQLDSVDMFFFHGLGDHHDTNTCLEFLKGKEFRETVDAMKKSGKVKFVGFSCHHPDLALMLETAAQANVVDAIMVKYSAFAPKDHPFNKALDACHAKNIGLISMKQLLGSTEFLGSMADLMKGLDPKASEEENLKAMGAKLQSSEASRLKAIAEKAPASLKEKGLKPYEMLLHAIWTDERIATACVSLKNTDQIIEGVHAARTFEPLKAAELDAIRELHLASNPTHCALCDGSCAKAAGTDAALGDLARFLAYHQHGGERTEARRQYASLTNSARDWKGADLAAAQAACPNHLNFAELLPKVDEYLA